MKGCDLVKLREPFPAEDLEWRLQSCGEKNGKFWGIALAYITSRAVQERLDNVCGPDGWQLSIRREGDAYLATLSIRVEHEDGTVEWISRTDGADATDIEPVKGGISGSIKRCAVLFGVGRYLYNLKDNFAIIDDKGPYSGKTKEGKWFKWRAPNIPDWALPADSKKSSNKQINKSGTAPTSPSKPAAPDSPELQKAIQTVTEYINNGQLNKSWIPTANNYISTKDLNGLNRVIKYMEEQIGKQVEAEIA